MKRHVSSADLNHIKKFLDNLYSEVSYNISMMQILFSYCITCLLTSLLDPFDRVVFWFKIPPGAKVTSEEEDTCVKIRSSLMISSTQKSNIYSLIL